MVRARPTALALSTALVLSACVPSTAGGSAASREEPHLAAWFDCVREGGVVISAHRGVSAPDQPENSIAAIEATGRAIPNAVLELDAALTRDGRLVLMHDETLDRTTTGRGRVADLDFATVRRARLTDDTGRVTAEPPPTLAEALDAAGRVGAIASVDLKPADPAATITLAEAVIAEVRRAGAADRVILITYSAETARAVAALAPEMMISAGVKDEGDLAGLSEPQILAWTGSREPNPALWRMLKARGVEAQFGTLGPEATRLDTRYAADGDPSEYRDLIEDGVTVIATDTPMTVARVLAPGIAAAARCER